MKCKLPYYETILQSKFEDMVIDILKDEENLTTVKAVQRYLELCNQVDIHDEKCKINNTTYSIRRYIIYKLRNMKYIEDNQFV